MVQHEVSFDEPGRWECVTRQTHPESNTKTATDRCCLVQGDEKMESFDICLKQWMAENEFPLMKLTAELGYKSKTTIARVLSGQYTYKSCMKIYKDLQDRKLINAQWGKRFEDALRNVQRGKKESEILEAFRKSIMDADTETVPDSVDMVPLTDLLILGCPWKETDHIVSGILKANADISILHAMSEKELLQYPEMFMMLIEHLPHPQYMALLIPENKLPDKRTRHLALGKDAKSGLEYILVAVEDRIQWMRLDGAHHFEACRTWLDSLGGTPLYRNEQMESGVDYIHMMQQSYEMEHGHYAAIIKPTMGVQMIPARLTVEAFDDTVEETHLPLKASRETMVYLLQKRVENVLKQQQALHLIVSQSSMEKFVRSGYLSDHFYACRPYSKEERKAILDYLLLLISKGKITLHFWKKKKELPVSCEAYENVGVLIYPGQTNYYSRGENYRELFLPGKTLFPVIDQFVRELGMSRDCMSTEETERKLTQYSAMLGEMSMAGNGIRTS